MPWLALAIVLATIALTLAKAAHSQTRRTESRRIALQIIEDRLMLLRGLPYADLLERRGEVAGERLPAAEGEYQVETEMAWDSPRKRDNLCISVSIHGGGVGAFRPLFGSFIIAPAGSFVGEHSAGLRA